ncbi:MAG: 7-cyano-7-deazaguanine synthase, partial [bacterium JZ-2024 1]
VETVRTQGVIPLSPPRERGKITSAPIRNSSGYVHPRPCYNSGWQKQESAGRLPRPESGQNRGYRSPAFSRKNAPVEFRGKEGKMAKILLMLSGGPDSTTLLADLLNQGHTVRAVVFNYGQNPATQEVVAARAIALLYGVPLDVFDLSGLGTLLRSVTEPPHMLMDTCRDPQALLGLAGFYAGAIGFDSVAYAANQRDVQDQPGYPNFFRAAQSMLNTLPPTQNISILTPFLNLTKAQVLQRGQSHGVDWTKTWSCWNDVPIHDGTCGGCLRRKEAFQQAGIPDPTQYAG